MINFEGNFGLERETLRVQKNNRLATTPHPFFEECFSRDFSENQLEIVTPVCNSTEELINTMKALDTKAREILKQNNEALWMYSNPPYFESEDEFPLAEYVGEEAYRKTYREYLKNRYGKRLMMYSGIHFNFSFKEKVSSEDYIKIFKYLNLYSYIFVLLTAASPVFDGSLVGKKGRCFDGYSSRRNGKKGYWNKFIPYLDYSSVDAYVDSVERYVKEGKLYSSAELYMPVRIKPRKSTDDLSCIKEKGIDHIELRMFDVNPLSEIGIKKEDLDFAHYMILYLMSREDFNFSKIKQNRAIKRHKKSAELNLPKTLTKSAIKVLEDMKFYFKRYPFVCENIDFQLDKLQNGKRYCKKILEDYFID